MSTNEFLKKFRKYLSSNIDFLEFLFRISNVLYMYFDCITEIVLMCAVIVLSLFVCVVWNWPTAKFIAKFYAL